MDGDSRGGDDTLIAGGVIGGFGTSLLMGDAGMMRDNASGGDDTLSGGVDQNNTLTATPDRCTTRRAAAMTGWSAEPRDHMWGDAQFIDDVAASPAADTGLVATGADTFAFATGGGTDDIGDFRQRDGDRIDVSAYGFTSLVDMMITFDGANTKIAFDTNDSVTLTGFAGTLRPADFVFA